MHHRGTRWRWEGSRGEKERERERGDREERDKVHRISHISEPRDVAEIPNHSRLESTLFLVYPVLFPSPLPNGTATFSRPLRRSVPRTWSSRKNVEEMSKLFFLRKIMINIHCIISIGIYIMRDAILFALAWNQISACKKENLYCALLSDHRDQGSNSKMLCIFVFKFFLEFSLKKVPLSIKEKYSRNIWYWIYIAWRLN